MFVENAMNKSEWKYHGQVESNMFLPNLKKYRKQKTKERDRRDGRTQNDIVTAFNDH